MKIGYILKKFPRLSETFILNELLALEALGHEVTVFSLRAPDDEPRHESLNRLKAKVVVVRPLAPKSIFLHMDTLAKKLPETKPELEEITGLLDYNDPWCMEALALALPIARHVEEQEVEHLHAHFATSAAATAQEVSRRTGVPFSFTMHAKDIYRNTVKFKVLSQRIEDAAFGVTVCKANAEWLKMKCTAGAAERIRVLYNGIDLEQFSPGEDKRLPLIVAVGRFVEKKGFDDLLRACSLLKDKGMQFNAVIAGQGECEQALRALHAELGLQEIVDMPGAITQTEVRKLLRQATVLAAPCVKGVDGNQDALPTVMLEALACATPCIGTPVGGIPEIARDGIEGWIIPSRDSKSLANAMEHALKNEMAARQRGEAGRRRVEEVFNLKRNARQLANWIQESAERAVGRP